MLVVVSTERKLGLASFKGQSGWSLELTVASLMVRGLDGALWELVWLGFGFDGGRLDRNYGRE